VACCYHVSIIAPFFRYYHCWRWPYHSWIVLYLWVIGITKVLNSKSDVQTHSRSLVIMPFDRPYMISSLSSIVTMSLILHLFRDITYFPKFKGVMWLTTPTYRTVCNPIINQSSRGKPVYRIWSLLALAIWRYFRGTENLNGSRDHNYAPFRDGLSSMGWDYPWTSGVPNLKSLHSPITKIWKATKSTEIGVVWGLRSLKVIGNIAIR